ncbi:MAG: D-hexose-6-phosphate mutarotase [Mariprofundaceae bacterium]
MANLEQLNEKHGIAKQLTFVSGKGGMPIVEIKNNLGKASIALQGAHLLDYQTNGESELIWMSEDATFAEGKSLRGGVPICWPWFGPHSSDSTLPGHGPARTTDWNPVASEVMSGGQTKISFELVENDKTREMCPHPLRVQLHVTVGKTLLLELETTNLGKTEFTLGQALHTYFHVSDVRLSHVDGLYGCTYIDKIDGGQRKSQQGPVMVATEIDRVYLGTGNHVEIIDPAMGRKIIINSSGSASMVIWNPWDATAKKMGDLGQDGFLKMLCVETANAADDVVVLAAGSTHNMGAEY